jgi:hypothetical protein
MILAVSLIAAGLLNAFAAHSGSGITVAPDGFVYFNDMARNIVWRIEDDGSLTLIARDVHTNVLEIGEDGSIHYPPGGYPPEGFYFVTRAPDGAVFATIQSRIARVLDDGALMTVAGDSIHGFRDGPAASARFDHPQGIAVDSLGSIYVADHGNRRVRLVTSSGEVKTIVHSGWPWTPTGLAIKGDQVYVLERFGKYWGVPIVPMLLRRFFDHPRVRVIAPDGNVQLVAAVSDPDARTAALTQLAVALAAFALILALIVRWRRSAHR